MKFSKNPVESYRRLFSLSSDIFCVVDRSGIILELNLAWTHILGYAVESCVGQSVAKFIHPADHSLVRLERPQPGESNPGQVLEIRYLTASGDVRILSWTGTYFPEEDVFFGIARDVTRQRQLAEEQERVQAAVQQSEQKYRCLIESLSEVVITMGPEGAIDYVSPRAQEMLGFSPSYFIGKRPEQIVHPDDISNVHSTLERALTTKSTQVISR